MKLSISTLVCPISEMKILSAVAEVYNISIKTLLKRENRKRVITEPRQMAMFLMRKYTAMRYAEIGKIFDKPFGHTTVIHGVTVIQNDIDTNEVVMQRYFELEEKLFNEKTIKHETISAETFELYKIYSLCSNAKLRSEVLMKEKSVVGGAKDFTKKRMTLS